MQQFLSFSEDFYISTRIYDPFPSPKLTKKELSRKDFNCPEFSREELRAETKQEQDYKKAEGPKQPWVPHLFHASIHRQPDLKTGNSMCGGNANHTDNQESILCNDPASA